MLTEAAARVLIVEDDEDDAFLIRDYVTGDPMGGTAVVDRAATVPDALAKLGREPYDVLLVDYRLGAEDGFALLREARSRKIRVPAILLTGYGSEEVAVEAMKAGVVDYFSKVGLDPKALAAAVRNAAELGRTRRDKERAEGALRESEERYRQVFEQSLTGNVVSTVEGRVLACNRAFARMLGFGSVEEVLASDARAHHSTPEDRERFLDAVRRQGCLELHEMDMRRRDGKPLRVIANVVGIRDASGGLVELQCNVLDVTEKRRLEEQLQQAQRMEAVGRLAGGIAHDFNNLLTVILGFADLARSRLPPGDPQGKHLDEIRRAGDRAAVLTRQLLAYSRKQILEPRVLDLNGVAAGMVGMLRRLIGEDIDLRSVLAPDLARVFMDPGQMEQVIANLVVNARDAMALGGTLTLRTENVLLDQDFARQRKEVRPGPYVLLAITDTGVGMDEETRARVFEPYFTTKEKGRGTGLGLATVYGIVKQGGGYIYVESEPGKGTTFRIYLPRSERSAEALPGAPPAPSSAAGVETILVVEDEEAILHLAEEILRGRGYTVVVARSTEEALEAVRKHQGPLHLLLTDVVLAGGNGRTLAKLLAELRPGVKVLYMSGYTDDTVIQHGVSSDEVAFLQKPFTAERLARRVREVLG